MTVKELAEQLNLKVIGGEKGLEKEISGGYTSDLLSDVIGNAEQGNIWITLQTHKNVMAVASLKDLSAVLIVKGFEPEPEMIAQSNEEEIPVLQTHEAAFSISGKVYNFINVYSDIE